MRAPGNIARIVIALAAVGAIVLVVVLAGWADDKAPSGSNGRVTVTTKR